MRGRAGGERPGRLLWGAAGRERGSARFDGLQGHGEACWQAPRRHALRGPLVPVC